MPLNLIFTQPGTFTIDDNGIPGDGISVIRDSNGVVIFTFAHPADALGLTVNIPGVNLVINFTDSLGSADFSIGDLTSSVVTPNSVVMKSVRTTGNVTLVSNTTITEGGADAAADVIAGTLIMSAQTGVGTAGNALETQTSFIEAERVTGGITVGNIGSVQIGGLTDQVNGLDVLTSGNLNLSVVGSIFLSDLDLDAGTNPPDPPAQTVHGGNTSGNVTLTAQGFLTDIITNTDTDAVSAPRGNIVLNAGRDIAFGTIGVDFDNDVRANGSVTINAGRDFLLDGFSDLSSDDFFNNTGGGVIVNAGRNIQLRDIAGSDATLTASGTAGADVVLTTGAGGALILDAPSANAVNSSSGDVIVNADRVLIGASSGITSTIGGVTLRPVSAGRGMILGSASDAALAVEIADSELDRIFTTKQLFLGGSDTGMIRVIAPFSPANAANLTIRTGANISIESSFAALGAISLLAGDDIYQFGATVITAGGPFIALVDQAGDDGNLGGVGTLAGAVTATAVTLSGNAEADTLNGTDGANIINGNGGNDTLRGNGGNDALIGGAGVDTMIGGLGDDGYIVDHTGDIVTEAPGEGTDTVYTTVGYALAAGAVVEVLTPYDRTTVNAMNLFGNVFAQTIYGNNGVNLLQGGGATDVFYGMLGDDSYIVDDLSDQVFEMAGQGTDTVYTTGSHGLVAGQSIETLSVYDRTTVNAINLSGNNLGQTIYGNNGANIIDGKAGADTIFLLGGADAVRFTTALGGGNVNSVIGFQGGVDGIELDSVIFPGLAPGALPAGVLVVGALPSDANDRLLYNQVTGQLFFDADGNGAGAAILFATFNPGTVLTTTDFLVL